MLSQMMASTEQLWFTTIHPHLYNGVPAEKKKKMCLIALKQETFKDGLWLRKGTEKLKIVFLGVMFY